MMKKEELLQKYRNEQRDEGRDDINEKGDREGFFALCLLSLLLMMYKVWTKQPFGDIIALLFVFLSVGAIKRYQLDKDRTTLFFGIATGIITLASLIYFVIKTL